MSILTHAQIERLRALPLEAPVLEGTASLERLADQDAFWILAQGELDLFLQSLPPDGPEGERHHLCTFRAGQVLAGLRVPGERRDLRLVLVPAPGCRILAGPWERLDGTMQAQVREVFAEGAIARLTTRLDLAAPPRRLALLVPGATEDLRPGDCASVRHPLGWMQVLEGDLTLLGSGPVAAGPEEALPLVRGLWVQAGPRGARLLGAGREASGTGENRDRTAERILGVLLELLIKERARQDAAELERIRQGTAVDLRQRGRALESLARILEGRKNREAPMPEGDGGLLDVCRRVGGARGIAILAPPRWELEEAGRGPLEAICRASRVRFRQVALHGTWWKEDAGPLVGFLGPGRSPVALLPRPGEAGGYRLVDPAGSPDQDLGPELAAQLDPMAFTFYRPAPAGKLGLRELFLMVWRELRGDLRRVMVVSLGSGLLSLVLPVVMRVVTDQIIPDADVASLKVAGLAMAGMGCGGVLFNLARGFALLRLQIGAGANLQAAMVDRLLGLPVSFFKRFTVGDLLSRASAVDAIQGSLGSVTLSTGLSAAFSLLNFCLLLYYDAGLALVAVGVVAVVATFNGLFGRLMVRVERARQDAAGTLSGQTLQLLGGVAKLRVAAAEGRAFAHWCQSLLAERALAVRSNNLSVTMGVFNDVLSLVSTMALFAAVSLLLAAPGGGISPGRFIAFNAAYGSFCAGMLSLVGTLVGLLNIGPIYDRARPILEALPEDQATVPDPGRLAGRVEAHNLNFRYQPDRPLVLENVSFLAEPGSFIALAGPSGGGKSTIVRLLLGFERPEAGGIFYDSRDLQGLNLAGLRTQLGVVLQNSRLQPGSVYQSIVGTGLYSMDEAWEAAEAAGIAEDIRQMPMGMHTVVSEGGATLSGGQRQRLVIASVLVRRPRIVLFDEATSALDNRTQEIVAHSLERLNATRIVIAHRLSTIRRADRIYVLDHGKVVQEGTYDELQGQEGLFRQLAARQTA